MSWSKVCDISQVKEDVPYAATVEGKKIGIYRLQEEYYALEDICPHAYALLSQGFVEDGKVECPLHEAIFDLRSGRCLHGPGGRDLTRYPLRIRDNQIEITLIKENGS
ncbi:non-heme iron oxygenase ferredoxin subunit [Pantoea sp. 1.19]|uniref:Rieske (2Fe-2S) protein n=1 Tax=Pantoea sp. 1.19 TaxID=1925589 RepID=UPI000949191D|nr:non-heme iron oxygenase ferredoxin subunit [Pantoea sp. 1.19]